MIKCSECGYENMDGLDYCDGCGAKLAAAEAPRAAAAAAPLPRLKRAAAAARREPAPAESAAEAPASDRRQSEAPTGEIEPSSEAERRRAAAAAPAAAAAACGRSRRRRPHFRAKLSVVRGGRKGQEFPLEGGQEFHRPLGSRDRRRSRKWTSSRTIPRPKFRASTR